MTTFTQAVPPRVQPNRAKHVNYTYGMVLGVDDFTQEFAYDAGKHQQQVSELAGYGRVRGLDVTFDVPPGGTARLVVQAGLAYLPTGQPVLVDRAQCADLDAWLEAHRGDVEAGLGGTQSGTLDLVVVLEYAACETDARPIPGEPCRSEDDLMAASRIKDDFSLELRRPPPSDQREVEATRAFVRWLRAVPIAPSSSSTVEELLAALLAASGVVSTPDDRQCPDLSAFLVPPTPPSTLSIPRAEAAAWLRGAFALWTRELLPCWRHLVEETGVTLARLALPVLYNPVEDTFTVDPAPPPPPGPVTQDDVPFLVHSQLLQEWLLSTPDGGGAQEPIAVASGWFDLNGDATAPPFFATGGLQAQPRTADPGVYDLHFDAFDAAHRYLVTGAPYVKAGAGTHTFEVVEPSPDGAPAVQVRRAIASGSADFLGFQVQIVRIP